MRADPAKAPVAHAVMAATQLAPQIVAATVRASRGPRHERLDRIRDAQRLTRLLTETLAVAESACIRARARQAEAEMHVP